MGKQRMGKTDDYPVPVSPLPPPHSNEIERRRADRAEAFFRELESGILSWSMSEEELLRSARATEEENASMDLAHQSRPEVGPTRSLESHTGDFGLNVSTPFPEILYEDGAMLALNKPPGLYCHHVAELMEQFLRKRDEKLQEIRRGELMPNPQPLNMIDRRGERTPKPEPLTMVHRLDRDTSGVMLLAKTPEAATALGREFARHSPRKTYIALGTLHSGGTPLSWTHTRVRTGHGRSRHGLWRVYRSEDVGRGLPGGNKVKDMETDIEVLWTKKVQNANSFAEEVDSQMKDQSRKASIIGENISNPPGTASTSLSASEDSDGCLVLLRALPRTGRTHQIRLHCQFLGIPLVGDVKYGGATGRVGSSADRSELAGHALHAEMIEISHPLTKKRMLLQAPRPAWCPSAT